MHTFQEPLDLLEPTYTLQRAYLSMIEEHQQAGEDYYDHELARNNFRAYIQMLAEQSQGIDLPPGVVPMTTYWLVRDNQEVFGESRLRHFLTPALEHHGGHIGYIIRPLQRQKGYGSMILALTLEKARNLGIARVRITCDTDNWGSIRVIEKNGGILSSQIISERSGKLISQYWVELGYNQAV